MRTCLFVVAFAASLAGNVGSSAGQAPLPPDEAPVKKAAERPRPKQPELLSAKPMPIPPGADELQRLLIERRNAAVAEVQASEQMYNAGVAPLSTVYDATRRLLEADLELSDKPADRIAALERLLELAKFVEWRIESNHVAQRAGGEVDKLYSARGERLTAEIRLLKAKRSLAPKP